MRELKESIDREIDILTKNIPEKGEKSGLKISRFITKEGVSPFDEVEWEKRTAEITDDQRKLIFQQKDVEFPKNWSNLATNVVCSKYFYGEIGTPQRENSLKQLIHRVVKTITDWGTKDGYFASEKDAKIFYDELCAACLNQYGSFNSPVWFNVGLYQVYGCTSSSRKCYVWDNVENQVIQANDAYKYPQASACFIQSVQDNMEDIMKLATTEAILFKYGSGTGTDLSTLRSSKEKLSGGGRPSGPISFMRVFDQIAAVIKSGGKTRRAAKMQILRVDHPDIMEFIECKVKEEKKAWALIDAGYSGSFDGEAYSSVMFQNCNLSVRVTDEFMKAVEQDGVFHTKAVTTGQIVETLKAREVMRKIAEATYICGDPGIQYHDTINKWHTCSNSAPINASNPCSEFMFVDNSACNLASVNLCKFLDQNGKFNIPLFKHIIRLFIIAQDILVDNASYPTYEIAYNSHLFRPLGLGYANLGAILMRLGYPYDSEEGRAYAAGITALMTGAAYNTSIELAKVIGPFERWNINSTSMMQVMRMHWNALSSLSEKPVPEEILTESRKLWKMNLDYGEKYGFRNAQVTLLAPTGTIGFMMDCDTTGIEPDIALVKYKQLAGGGLIKIVNSSIKPALERLGYNEDQIKAIIEYIEKNDTIEGAPELKEEHLPVFDCAFPPKNGKRHIHYLAHIKMMAAIQPFLSGAISKTVNMPKDTTVEEIMNLYIEGWKLGLKSVAIYRDGSKRTQPLTTGKDKKSVSSSAEPFRRRMPETRLSITHKFSINGHEGYLTVGMYEDGKPGELFITMAKEGSTVGGMMDAFGTAISLCLQYGVPLKELCRKFSHSRFEPSGFTQNPDIPVAKSIVDYIFRWLELTFPEGKNPNFAKLIPYESKKAQKEDETIKRIDSQFSHFQEDAPACDRCGAITVRNGACYKCYNCGNSMGCS